MQLEYIPPEVSKDAKSENAEEEDDENGEKEQEIGIEGGTLGLETTLRSIPEVGISPRQNFTNERPFQTMCLRN